MAKVKQTKDDVTIIKKYANRRLYDTGRSSYVTLDDLSEMVREGYNFVVQDAKTGKDITRSVLAQIIVDKESNDTPGGTLLGTEFLRKLIGLYGAGAPGLQAFMPKYLENTLDIVMKNQEMLREHMTKSMQTMGQNMGGMKGMASINPLNNPMNPMNAMKNNPMMKSVFPMASLEDIHKQNMAAFERTMKMFTPFGAGFGASSETKSDE